MHFRRPTGLPIKYRSFALGKCFFNLDFILDAPFMILRAYKDLDGRSFAVPALNEYQVLACSGPDIQSVSEASEDKLSFHAAMTDRLKHKYTMFGFEHNDIDPHNAIPGRTIKVLLRIHLPAIRPMIEKRINEGFNYMLGSSSPDSDGWMSVSTFGLARSITERVNAQICLGTELADSPNFMEAASRYSHDAILAAEICRQLPSVLTPLIAPVIMKWSGAMHKVQASLQRVVEARIQGSSRGSNQPMDCLQWIIQSSHTNAQRAPGRLLQQAGAIFFASSHQMPMALVYAIYTLCVNPEYVKLLREEASSKLDKEASNPFKRLILLDAFLRESARLNPLDALSIQKKVMQPFDLPSGARIPAGNLVAVPQQAILRNEHLYPDPESFNPFRYLSPPGQPQAKDFTTRYTDVNTSYPYWGSPRKPCPGRWYVSETMKLAILHLIMNYDVKLVDEQAPRSFFWTTALVPRMDTKILLKTRSK
ncbi:cytochrome P450 [Lindgomyces ingoldianus]|uniref:Cytochrome P450 n=1 Tax=Lindgomyces ingoldianus TaxID=673940 RepID=A0ACB6QCC8_9PLEO|nr:cytochrome P450 [Lindgomyces ingoldianus]KAF2464155.1 cytochrome P450 [Lindgomyces ingoldianus]